MRDNRRDPSGQGPSVCARGQGIRYIGRSHPWGFRSHALYRPCETRSTSLAIRAPDLVRGEVPRRRHHRSVDTHTPNEFEAHTTYLINLRPINQSATRWWQSSSASHPEPRRCHGARSSDTAESVDTTRIVYHVFPWRLVFLRQTDH